MSAWLKGRGWVAVVAAAQLLALLVAAGYVLATARADNRSAGRYAARQTQLDRIERDVERICAAPTAPRCAP